MRMCRPSPNCAPDRSRGGVGGARRSSTHLLRFRSLFDCCWRQRWPNMKRSCSSISPEPSCTHHFKNAMSGSTRQWNGGKKKKAAGRTHPFDSVWWLRVALNGLQESMGDFDHHLDMVVIGQRMQEERRPLRFCGSKADPSLFGDLDRDVRM